MRLLPILLLSSSLAFSVPAFAAAQPAGEAQTDPGEHRLSVVEVDKVLEEAAHKREAAEKPSSSGGIPIHGEFGFAIGTGGYRSAFGSAMVPLGDEGMAAFSFETRDLGHWR